MKFMHTFTRGLLLTALFVLLGSAAWAQRTVKGKVTDAETGEGLIGASVTVVGTTRGAITDLDGNYSVEVPQGSTQLRFAYTGYAEMTIELGASNIQDVAMKPGTALDEVVVVGYGSQKKRDVTGAVGSVSSENFNKGVNVVPEQLIQGKVAGVNITTASGEPGAGVDIQIRGAGSIRSGNQPLYVIDGVPITSANSNAGGVDNDFGTTSAKNPLSFLNPEDIETIDILKDASATAIYGARGANGVVLITTKKGSAGRSTAEYSGYYGISNLARKIDVLDAAAITRATDAIYAELGTPNTTIEPQFRQLGINTDWQDEIFRTAGTQNHNLSLSGGAGKGTYFASLNLFDQDGLVLKNNLRRYTGRFNFSQKALNDRLKFDLNLTASQVRDNSIPLSNNSGFRGDVFINAIRLNPTYPVYQLDANGNTVTDANGNPIYYEPPGDSNINPRQFLDIFDDKSQQNRILGNLTTSFEILPGLTFRNNFGIDNATTDRAVTIVPNPIGYLPTGQYSKINRNVYSKLMENYLTYNFVKGDHDVSLLAGHAYQYFFERQSTFTVRNLTNTAIDPINNPNVGTDYSSRPPSGSAQANELQSFFGRVTYGLKDGRYQLTATLRADGSTRFGEDNKYGYFPSFAAGWRISDESFMSGIDKLDNLKLRVGWGQTGIQEVPNKITQGSFSQGTGDGAWLDGSNITPGITLTRTPNEALQWETSTQTNIGLDFGWNNGRITGTINYFNRVSTNTLLEIPSKAASPTPRVWLNLPGDIVNSGVELELGYTPIRNNKFSWTVNGNCAFINNTVRDMPFSRINTGELHGQGLTGAFSQVIRNDEAVGSFFLWEWEGLDENGVNQFRDVNGDGAITDADKVIVGTALPNFTWGLVNSFSYGKFDFSIFFNGVHGNKVYNNTYNATFTRTGLSSGTNATTTETNSAESIQNTPTPSTRYLEDGSFIRLNNATLGYNLKFAATSWFKSVRVYVTGQNLALFTDYKGYDPEVNINKSLNGVTSYGIDYSAYPRARTFMFGLNASF